MSSKRTFRIGLAITAVLLAAAIWRIEATAARILETRYAMPAHPLLVAPAQVNAKAGERFAHLDGCFICHGPHLTGRVVFHGWFGTRVTAPNLTRIARRQTDAQLAAAIRFGIEADGTSIIDMPSNQFIKSSDSEIASIIAYLRTLPQRPNTAAQTQWRFGGKAMLAIGLFPVEARIVNAAARGPVQTPQATTALGHYLTQAHCSVCHGANLSGKTEMSSPGLRFSIQHYSLAAFERFFTSGIGGKGHGTKVMTPMIKNRLHYLTKADVQAIYAYLNAPAPITQ